MLTLTYEYKLKPNNRERAIFEDWLEINRKVYNYALNERKAWLKSRSCHVNCCSLQGEYIISAESLDNVVLNAACTSKKSIAEKLVRFAQTARQRRARRR